MKHAKRGSQVAQPPLAAPDRTTLFHLLILSAAGFALYAYSLGNGFVADDGNEVLKDPLIRSFANIPTMFAHGVWFFMGSTNDRYYRPLKLLTYSLEYHLFGFQPSLWHLVNILIYVATVIAMYFLVRDLISDPSSAAPRSEGSFVGAGVKPAPATPLAFWTALFFAFHPIHVEAVAWVAAGNDLLCGLMVVLSIWLYHRARQPGGMETAGLRPVATLDSPSNRAGARTLVLYGGSVALFFAGLLFKEEALTFPAVILAYDFCYRGESLQAMLRGCGRYLLYFLVLGAYLALRVHALRGLAPGANPLQLTPTEIMLNVPVVTARYVGKGFLPINQNFWYGYEPVRRLGWAPIAAVVLILLLVLAVLRLRHRQPLLSLALAWFLIFLVPALDLSKTSFLLADRYLYLSSFGFCVFAAWAWLWLRERASRAAARRAVYVCLTAVLIFYTVVIARRLPDWRDDSRIWMKTAQQSVNVAFVAAQAAAAYLARGRLQDALSYAQRAVALNPESPLVHFTLGTVYLRLGRGDDAAREAEKSVQLGSKYEFYWANLAFVYRKMGQWAKAVETCREGLALHPDSHDLLIELGLAELQMGHSEQGIAAFRRAITADPGSLDSYVNLASVLVQQGQFDSAIDQLLAGLAASPRAPDAYMAHYQLGVAYQAKGLWPAAAQEYRRALELQPGFAPARAKLEGLESAPAGTQP